MPAVDTFYDVAMRRLSEQIDRVDRLDTKLAAVFTAAAAVLPIFGALLALFGRAHPEGAVILAAYYDEATVRLWVTDECVRSIEENRARLRREADFVSVAVGLVALDAILLAISAALLLV